MEEVRLLKKVDMSGQQRLTNTHASNKKGASWCCENYCWLAIMLWCGYCVVVWILCCGVDIVL